MRIIVSGKLAGAAGQGGATWAVLQYLLGLRRLGHDVWFVEPVKTLEHKSGAYFRAIVEEFGATTVVYPGWRARMDAAGNLMLEPRA